MAESEIIPPIVKAPVANPATVKQISLKQLLEDEPLHSPRTVTSLFSQPEYGNVGFPDEIHVHCDHEKCEGVRRHTGGDNGKFKNDDDIYVFVTYKCTNCTVAEKIFGLKTERDGAKRTGICTKIYQEPPFGHPIPKRLFDIIGEENREYFLQARRAIARGLGIGAYGYYRRIVENNKFDLVSSVLEIAKATNASTAQIALLENAKAEKQFSKAIEMLRDVSAIPAVLLIDGHNPLALLHDLLSEGIHELTDAECLERSKEAEVVLCEIADRMQIALTERKTVKAAISSILNRKNTARAKS